MKKTLTLILLFFLVSFLRTAAQKVSGEWYGVGNINHAGEHSNYLSELVLKQTGNTITGEFNYYFKRMSIVNRVTGVYDPKLRTVELKLIPVLNYKAKSMQGADCPMEGSFTLRISKADTTLYGQFNPTYKYRFTCPAITIRFTRQRVKPKEDPQIKMPELTTEVAEVPKVIPPPPEVVALTTRSFDASPVFEVDADSLKVALYDNGDIDQDTISLFYNRKLIGSRQMLSLKPLNYTLPLDTSINEISMFAENLGLIAPNTALAIIYAGEERFELNMTSNFIKNATIRFRRKPKTEEPK